MSLAAFFEAIGPYLRGQSTLADLEQAVGPSASPARDLEFYPWLVAFDQQRILAELCPACRRLVDRLDEPRWTDLVAAYVVDHPPTGISVPGVGEAFADWLAARRVSHPEQPAALECLADLYWTRFLARTAPDLPGVGLDQRLFVRAYPVDVLAVERALMADEAPPADQPCTLVVFRHTTTLEVRQLVPSLATLAVLALRQGQALQGPFAALGAEVLAAEEERLVRLGVLPAETTG